MRPCLLSNTRLVASSTTIPFDTPLVSCPESFVFIIFCQKLIESLDGVEALWCTPDGEVIQSSGWADHEKK